MNDLQERIGYRFRDPGVLEQALSHASLHPDGAPDRSYQRLEFLGDAALNLCVAEEMYRLLPAAGEGVLSRARAAVINNRNLVKVGERIGLGEALRTDPSVRTKGGGVTRKMVADAVEAVIGAILVDGGYEGAVAFVRRHFAGALVADGIEAGGDFKSRLQEWCQAHGYPLPAYRVVRTSGPPHSRTFIVDVRAGAGFAGEGSGRTKKEAEMEAAAGILDRIGRGAL